MLKILVLYCVAISAIFCADDPRNGRFELGQVAPQQRHLLPRGFGAMESCGPIRLALYGINTLRPTVLKRKIKVDSWFGLEHAGLLVCGIEFHFGYEFLISICEQPKEGAEQIRCTNELHPEFEFEQVDGKLAPRIKPKTYLKFGRIAENQKTRPSQHLKVLDLYDKSGKLLRTDFSMGEVLNVVVNQKMRGGQSDFPQLEPMEAADGRLAYKVFLEGKRMDDLIFPEQVDSVEKWNHIVKTIENLKKRDLLGMSSIDPALVDFYEKLHKISNGDDNHIPENEKGPFGYDSYSKIFKNCVDFGVRFAAELSPDQQADWPKAMTQLKALKPLRFAYSLWKNGVTALLDKGHEFLNRRKMDPKLLTKYQQINGDLEENEQMDGSQIGEMEERREISEMKQCLDIEDDESDDDDSSEMTHSKWKKLLGMGLAASVILGVNVYCATSSSSKQMDHFKQFAHNTMSLMGGHFRHRDHLPVGQVWENHIFK